MPPSGSPFASLRGSGTSRPSAGSSEETSSSPGEYVERQRRRAWITYYVGAGNLDEARRLGWNGKYLAECGIATPDYPQADSAAAAQQQSSPPAHNGKRDALASAGSINIAGSADDGASTLGLELRPSAVQQQEWQSSPPAHAHGPECVDALLASAAGGDDGAGALNTEGWPSSSVLELEFDLDKDMEGWRVVGD